MHGFWDTLRDRTSRPSETTRRAFAPVVARVSTVPPRAGVAARPVRFPGLDRISFKQSNNNLIISKSDTIVSSPDPLALRAEWLQDKARTLENRMRDATWFFVRAEAPREHRDVVADLETHRCRI